MISVFDAKPGGISSDAYELAANNAIRRTNIVKYFKRTSPDFF
jgi:hypothetical protein